MPFEHYLTEEGTFLQELKNSYYRKNPHDLTPPVLWSHAFNLIDEHSFRVALNSLARDVGIPDGDGRKITNEAAYGIGDHPLGFTCLYAYVHPKFKGGQS